MDSPLCFYPPYEQKIDFGNIPQSPFVGDFTD